MTGSRRVPWDLIESVGHEIKRTSGAVYTRWMAQREARGQPIVSPRTRAPMGRGLTPNDALRERLERVLTDVTWEGADTELGDAAARATWAVLLWRCLEEPLPVLLAASAGLVIFFLTRNFYFDFLISFVGRMSS